MVLIKILITGGFGFIGSNLIQRLLLENHNITVIDDLSSGIAIAFKDINFYNLTVQDSKCEKIFEDTSFDIVVHLAYKGYSKENYNVNNNDLYENNRGLSNILYLSYKYKVKKVIILSSFKIYGKGQSKPYAEIDITEPYTFEGISYLCRETLVKEYEKINLNTVILRVGAVYGPDQYGTDLSFIKSNGKTKGDFIYIEDFCDCLIKVMLSHTDTILNISNGEGESNLMDNSKAKFSLNWYPKFSFDEGIKLAKDRSNINTKNNDFTEEKTEMVVDKYKGLKQIFNNKDTEVTILFIISFYINYLVKYKLGLNIDLFILYIVLVSLIYGLKQGITSVFLSAISYVWFSFNYEGKTTLSLINDIGSILYLTLYFLLGTSIGYLVDEQRKNRMYLVEEAQLAKDEINFIKELYSKSQEVRNNLQNTIENYDNNLTKINRIINKLNTLSMEVIYNEIPAIYADNFYSRSVGLYKLDSNKTSLSLISKKGEIKHNKSINIKEFEYLQSVINDKKIIINRDINRNLPTICIPIYSEGIIFGIVFLDEIEFRQINQQYINDLKVTTNLLSSLIYKSYKYEKAIGGR